MRYLFVADHHLDIFGVLHGGTIGAKFGLLSVGSVHLSNFVAMRTRTPPACLNHSGQIQSKEQREITKLKFGLHKNIRIRSYRRLSVWPCANLKGKLPPYLAGVADLRARVAA